MDVINILKSVGAVITLVIGLFCGIVELKKDSKSSLHRFLSGFYISCATGFLLYSLYHLIITNSAIVIPIMISSLLFIDFGIFCLVFAVLLIGYKEETVMTKWNLFFGLLIYLLVVSSYLIWTPTLNMEEYSNGFVDTDVPVIPNAIMSFYRMIAILFVIIRLIIIRRIVKNEKKKRIGQFILGNVFFFLGSMLFFIRGAWLEIFGLIVINVGVYLTFRSFSDNKDQV